MSVLCPELIGRHDELLVLSEVIDHGLERRGRVVFVVGEPGIGKSRLLREAVAEGRRRGLRVLSGRASQRGSMVAYRPLAEALLSELRTTGPPAGSELAPFGPALGHLVPEWRTVGQTAAEESPVVIAEAMLRVLRVLAGDHATLLALEDLHWADPETLSVLEYLADNLGSEPVICVATVRQGEPGPAEGLVRALAARRAALAVELHPLPEADVVNMTKACLGMDAVPDDLWEMLQTQAEGIPFLVEELLAASVMTGTLVQTDEGWSVAGALGPAVPATFADMVSRRVEGLSPDVSSVLAAAATIGRTFDWTLLSSITLLDEAAVLSALRRAVDAQLVAAGGQGPSRFRFRHALTRDAVISGLLPPERSTLAEQALRVVESAHPDLEGEWCELAAELAQVCGQFGRAAQLLLQSGRRSLERGALKTAEEALDRAHQLASEARDPTVRTEIEEALSEVLALAGDTERVFAVGEVLLRRLADIGSPVRQAHLRLRLARAAIAAARWSVAGDHLDHARALCEAAGDEGLLARTDALAAQLSIATGRLDEAVELATSAFAAAERVGLPEVACEALEVIGRRARGRDLDEAAGIFDRALDVAERHGLVVWRIRALHERATIDFLSSFRIDTLLSAYDAALGAGALATAAAIDLQIAAALIPRFQPEQALYHATRCVEASRRLRLGATLAVGLVYRATAHGQRGELELMEADIGEALAIDADDVNVAAGSWGSARLWPRLLADDRVGAIETLDTAMQFVRRFPSTSNPWPFRGLWALLRTAESRDGNAALAEAKASGIGVLGMNKAFFEMAEAVELGRAGDGSGADQTFARADERMASIESSDWFHHFARRVVSGPAFADGWGDPAGWLREAVVFFDSHGHQRLASACRSQLRRSGMPVPRRVRVAEVPPALQGLRISNREAEVLELLADGSPNPQIAARLYLSPRTVESHVASLMRKVGSASRSELVAFAARAFEPGR